MATYFGKAHYTVLEAIDELLKALPDGSVQNFLETPYTHPQNRQTYRSFDMIRDGFTILAMGFTGKKALPFKLKYIAQYNEMAAALKVQPKSHRTALFSAPAACHPSPSPKRAQWLPLLPFLPITPPLCISETSRSR